MINRNLAKILSKRYIILASVMFILALGLLFLPTYEKNETITAEDLLAQVINPERYITSDVLADKIINKDPSIVLVDLRQEKEYSKYTLSNSINIPFENILNEDYEGYFDQDQYEIVLFSNENFTSDQAWLLLTRSGYKNLHVLKGGINEWYNTILNPSKPTEDMSNEAFVLRDFRIAAAQYFGVGIKRPEQKVIKPKPKKKVVKKVVPIKKKKKRKPEGGC
ncbi:rhodanese-like domain-containing protein [Maribacter sp. HTCC2170]|uniref:rhodanese-like domain-containing protein n=1 Tax=Maribacter sp. (strain HTCC2170 / KCCM 42371) TaxID=313603 RepID=UPI00006AFC63|nr:rhodanese-like domain-containing protein [Maribacter sp. HTCC2170]EAR01349.1 hypothetical protein FB2170_11531 [Maribacter sp. HTCC2170]